MSDIHALVGAYAVDALDDLERAAFERHLADCSVCQAEVSGLREAVALIGATAAVEPPARLRDKVMADIATVRPLPPPVSRSAVGPTRGGRTRFRPRALVAAAAAVIALGAGVTVVQQWDDDTSQTQLTAAERISSADDAETFTQTLEDGSEATVIRSRTLNEAVLVTSDLPPPPDGKVYELWFEHEGVGMVAAGLMDGTEGEVELEGDPATAIGFGITVEPQGGSTEPTLPAYGVMDFEQA